MVVDLGHFNKDEIRACVSVGIMAYVPNPKSYQVTRAYYALYEPPGYGPGGCGKFGAHCFKKHLDRYKIRVILNESLGQAFALFIMTAVILRIVREVEIHFLMPGTAYA